MRTLTVLLLLIACACSAPASATHTSSPTVNASRAPSASAIRTTAPVTTNPTGPIIQLAEHYYDPSSITVKVGTTVTWINRGQQTHDVNAYDKSFASGNLLPGGTFAYTFTKPGTYRYYCIPHEGDGMTGEVNVTD
ncbi:MAG TPA: plastocyanin/azurin family copper-binding protein [Candidatus Limnocylindria bacterium]|jgi:plastocyanin|nr:plastocyanin/azurin family copper-binding protein [Candidatus Limnocylindria bacterium]